MPEIGIILLSHGSRLQEANEEVLALVEELRAQKHQAEFFTCAAFLQFGRPSLEEALEQAVARGCLEIIVAPLFLTSGMHITRDIPEILSREEKKYPGVKFLQCLPLGCDSRLVPIIWERIEEKRMEVEGKGAAVKGPCACPEEHA